MKDAPPDIKRQKLRILVAHPGLQHSHQLALALHKRSCLSGLWSGVPLTHRPGVGWARLDNSVRCIAIPPELRRSFVVFPLIRRTSQRLLEGEASYRFQHALDNAFDRLVSVALRASRFDVFIGYENSSLKSFVAARKQGALCILDAASVHPNAEQAWMGNQWPDAAARINRRKREEIAAADAVLTCSSLAAATYREAGGTSGRIFECPLGTELPRGVSSTPNRCTTVVSFVFVGHLSLRKGGDHLLDAFSTLAKTHPRARLTIIGGGGESRLLDVARRLSNVKVLSFIPQPALFDELARHNCLILPSRFDSFGMVVPEAMAVGLPAIVSERVGAKSIIESFPGSGWIIPVTEQALRVKIIDLLADTELIQRATTVAKKAAQAFSWASYHERVATIVETVVLDRKTQ